MPPSFDTTYIDPPLGVCVTTAEAAEKVNAFEASGRLATTQNLSEVIPQRPYFSTPDFLRAFEKYYADLKIAAEKITEEYAAILLVGGSGPIIDMVNNQRVHDLILAFYKEKYACCRYLLRCLLRWFLPAISTNAIQLSKENTLLVTASNTITTMVPDSFIPT